MKAFDPNYKLLDEMYQDDYYPAFLVDKVKDKLQKVIDLLESGETDTDVVQETLTRRSAASMISRRSLTRTTARSKRWPGSVLRQPWPTFWRGSIFPLTPRRPSGNEIGDPMTEKELAVCDECGSLFFKGSSQMMGLCPECAHVLYGYPNCDHHFQDGRCGTAIGTAQRASTSRNKINRRKTICLQLNG